jgi:ribosomal RNA-processing protein 12
MLILTSSFSFIFLLSLQPVICHGLETLCLRSDKVALPAKSKDMSVMQSTAEKLLPSLFRIVTSAADKNKEESEVRGEKESHAAHVNQNLQQIERAISGLARYSSPDFITGMFKKLMHRLLEELQKEQVDDALICSFLSLSNALVVSQVLSNESVSFLYRSLKPTLTEKAAASRRQKRAYKLLAALCEHHHAFFEDLVQLRDLVHLLATTVSNSQVAARSMRLKVLL